jgi:CheY-like chemotaxis protein
MPERLDMPLPESTLPNAGASSAPDPAQSPTRRRVLVIDDSVLVREAAKVALAAAGGYEVVVAESGEEGIELAASANPDAILLDVVMPGMDGLEVLERLRAGLATASIPVVMLTASSQLDTTEVLERFGVSGVIAKPFDVDALADRVAALLGWSA